MAPGGRLAVRPATLDDLPACERIWRDALDDYFPTIGIRPLPTENPAIGRLHRHTLASDPDLFRVAALHEDGVERVVAFASAVRREGVWFLSMLFVEPSMQGRGIGRLLLDETCPSDTEVILATATDAAQPISNALYASVGIVPRTPLLNLVGRPAPDALLPALPGGVEPVRATHGREDELPDPALAVELDALDRTVLGFAHQVDHGYVRREKRSLFTYRDAAGVLLGYGYASEVGRIAPIAVRDPDLLAPVLAHLLTAIEPRGASAVWLPGDAATATTLALRAGLRIEGFPVLVAASKPFADFSRYVPITPGLL